MLPKITDSLTWQQAEMLMQPAFIRVIDRIRQQLDVSDWKGTYQDELIWPDGTTDETKLRVTQLLQQLEGATVEQAAAIEKAIAQLPTPHPGYYLRLQRQDRQVEVDLWELCYQICFHHYHSFPVEIDNSLIDETGDVDWQRLDAKAKQLVEQMFANLPTD